MKPMEPKKLFDITPEEILKFWPSIDLDIWVFEKVLQGPYDVIEELKATHVIPSFSRDYKACYPLLIMAVMSSRNIEVSVDEGFFYEALARGQMLRKNEIKTWKIKDGDIVGYGRTFAEAICKFMICKTFNIRVKNA